MEERETVAAISFSHSDVNLKALRLVMDGDVEITRSDADLETARKSRDFIESILGDEKSVYGVNTGFGKLVGTSIEHDQLALLQRNLILSHSVGTGPMLDDAVVRLTLFLKVVSLARGNSGVRPEVIELLIGMYNSRIYPRIPAKGSVGASGDLAPLAHMTYAMMGAGEVSYRGEIGPATTALAECGLQPIELAAKEGLGLINGTQVSTALALFGLFGAIDLLNAGVAVGALATDGAGCNDTPFDARIHDVRGQLGQSDVAAAFRKLLSGSGIWASHKNKLKVQDPYSIRCQPQVLGACLDMIRFSAGVLLREAVAVTDNPLIFAEDQEVISGGNFHAEPVGFAADGLAIALSEIGSLSERRLALLNDSSITGLPPFLVENSGLNSGFMTAHIAAAALASENKTLAHPAVVDSIPTAGNQEDHVSMATFGARRLTDIADNVTGIMAIELLAAAQAIDFRAPLKSSEALMQVHEKIRSKSARWDKDRYFSTDIEAAKALLRADSEFRGLLTELVGPEMLVTGA